MVEVVGFEPTIFWSQTRRDTKLRYTSTLGNHYTAGFAHLQKGPINFLNSRLPRS